MKAWTPCELCKGKTPAKGLEGWFFVSDNPLQGVQECECHIAWREEGRRLARAQKNGVKAPFDFHPLEAYETSPDFPKVKKLVAYATTTFADRDRIKLAFAKGDLNASVYLYSKEVIGHTDLTRWMSSQLSKQGWNVAVVTMRSLIDGLTPVHLFEDEDLEKSKTYHQKLLDMDFLFIEGAFLSSESTGAQTHKLPYLDRFLLDRLENQHKPTIFLSNTPLTGITKANYLPTTQEVVMRDIKRSGGELIFSSGREIPIGSIFGEVDE